MADSKLQVTPTAIPDVLIIEPKVFGDNRGWFTESFNANDFAKATNLNIEFVQDNHSFSRQWTLRGMHCQIKHTQGKLVRVTAGSVFDVAVDLRKDSSTFGKWVGVELSSENHKQLWVPPGFAHGFLVLPGAEPPGSLDAPEAHQYSERLNLCHFGSLANDRSLSTILNALIPLFKKFPEARQRIRVHAYGAPLDPLTVDAVKALQFEDMLLAHGRLEKDLASGKSGRERVVEKMQAADVLILLHGNDEWCAEYIPSKLYDYLWTGRPIWGITHHNPQLDQMLLDRGAYLSPQSDVQAIELALEKIWLDWKNQQLIEPQWLPVSVDQAVQKILAKVDGNLFASTQKKD
jgi:dTDP-4-dehydrorhamnose 3,5-epimerase